MHVTFVVSWHQVDTFHSFKIAERIESDTWEMNGTTAEDKLGFFAPQKDPLRFLLYAEISRYEEEEEEDDDDDIDMSRSHD
jgi:hypothetical protein